MAAAKALAIQRTGMVTSVGLSSPSACAAIRSKLTNPVETRFVDAAGEWIRAHEVPFKEPVRGLAKLAKMAAMAIDECLGDLPRLQTFEIPLLLCVAERDRPGRIDGLEDTLFSSVEEMLGLRFSVASGVVSMGRVGAAIAMEQAWRLIQDRNVEQVIVAATDSLLSWPTLSHFERADRLLTSVNSNGFMPGEGACALLLTKPERGPQLLCTGVGFAMEKAHIDSGEPLRGQGLSAAIQAALLDAGCQMHDLDLRIADLSGEQYYFKEAALALTRLLRRRKEVFDLWHPAECTGEAGAMSGAAPFAVAAAACRSGWSGGSNLLVHLSNDAGQRAAAVLAFRAE